MVLLYEVLLPLTLVLLAAAVGALKSKTVDLDFGELIFVFFTPKCDVI